MTMTHESSSLVADEYFHDHKKVKKKVECNATVRYDEFSMIPLLSNVVWLGIPEKIFTTGWFHMGKKTHL